LHVSFISRILIKHFNENKILFIASDQQQEQQQQSNKIKQENVMPIKRTATTRERKQKEDSN